VTQWGSPTVGTLFSSYAIKIDSVEKEKIKNKNKFLYAS